PGVFKTRVPRESFQRRLLRYVLGVSVFSDSDYTFPVDPRGIEYADPREDLPDPLTPERRQKVTLGRYWDDFSRAYSKLPVMSDVDLDLRVRKNPLFKFDDLDKTFEFFTAVGLVTERSCAEICDALAGTYYAYGYASRSTVSFRSYVKIEKFDIYSKTP